MCVCLSGCLSACSSACLPACLSVCLSACLPLWLQAASYGKSVGGIFIVVLRIVVKSLLPAAGQLGRLRIGVSIHLALAAVILLGCVLVTSLAIPYLVDLVQQTESAEVPPGVYSLYTTGRAHLHVCLCVCVCCVVFLHANCYIVCTTAAASLESHDLYTSHTACQ
jgi:hypothetical protein